jgi:hypothetical protein
MNRNLETVMTSAQFLRRCLFVFAAVSGVALIAGCDDSVEAGGVGASVGLPTAFTNGPTDTADIGVGNVHWVGNPRW